MEYTPDEYTRYYIVQALFKLMNEYRFEEISVSDLARAETDVSARAFFLLFPEKDGKIVLKQGPGRGRKGGGVYDV